MAPSGKTIDAVFFALSDPSRRAIVEHLAHGEASIGTATASLDIGKSTISRHVGVLEDAGLVRRRVVGRTHLLSVVPDGFATVADWFAHHRQFWTSSLDRLEALVAELDTDGADGADQLETGQEHPE